MNFSGVVGDRPVSSVLRGDREGVWIPGDAARVAGYDELTGRSGGGEGLLRADREAVQVKRHHLVVVPGARKKAVVLEAHRHGGCAMPDGREPRECRWVDRPGLNTAQDAGVIGRSVRPHEEERHGVCLRIRRRLAPSVWIDGVVERCAGGPDLGRAASPSHGGRPKVEREGGRLVGHHVGAIGHAALALAHGQRVQPGRVEKRVDRRRPRPRQAVRVPAPADGMGLIFQRPEERDRQRHVRIHFTVERQADVQRPLPEVSVSVGVVVGQLDAA